jgi:hypothetical protein
MAKLTSQKNKGQKGMFSGETDGAAREERDRLRAEAPSDVATDHIVVYDRFRAMFPIYEADLEKVAQSMEQRGFDRSEPLVVWEEGGQYVLLDGHTRFEAAKRVGLETVPVTVRSDIESEEGALDYITLRQLSRRNLDEPGRFDWLRRNLDTGVIDRVLPGGGREREKVSRLLNVSPATAQRMISVARKADEVWQESIVLGEVGVYEIYNRINQPEDAGGDEAPTGPAEDSGSDEDGDVGVAYSGDDEPDMMEGEDEPDAELEESSDAAVSDETTESEAAPVGGGVDEDLDNAADVGETGGSPEGGEEGGSPEPVDAGMMSDSEAEEAADGPAVSGDTAEEAHGGASEPSQVPDAVAQSVEDREEFLRVWAQIRDTLFTLNCDRDPIEYVREWAEALGEVGRLSDEDVRLIWDRL